MDNLYLRENILSLLHEYTKTDSLRRHAYAVEAAMRASAQRTANDPEYWGAVGLLHDFDYEQYPEAPDHPLKGAEILRAKEYPDETRSVHQPLRELTQQPAVGQSQFHQLLSPEC